MNVGVARICAIVVLIPVAVCWFPAALTAQKTQATGQAADIESRRTLPLSLFDEEWQYELRSSPEMATSLGDNRYNDRLKDRSPEFYQSDLEARRNFLTRFEAIDPAGLSAPDGLSRELMIRNLRQDIEGALVNFAFGDVDEALVFEDHLAATQVAFGVCLAGAVDRQLCQSSHAEQFLPQFLHLLLKACAHYPNLPVT